MASFALELEIILDSFEIYYTIKDYKNQMNNTVGIIDDGTTIHF